MRRDGAQDPDQILATGAARGIPLEEFGLIWDSLRLRFGRASWGVSGLDPFLTYDVPYTGTSSGRLSEDAVQVFLASAAPDGPLQVLELGAGSGVFAKLFLDRLQKQAPKVYARTTYVVTDGSESVLSAQTAHGVLDAHAGLVERRVLNATAPSLEDGTYDAILGTYILDSLPFDLLAVKDGATWRKEARTVLDEKDADQVEPLTAALSGGLDAALPDWAWIAPRFGLQARHTPIERGSIPFADSLPRDTGGTTIPFVHCHGALSCLDACRRALRPGGVAIFSDYGHLDIMPRYEFLEFQAYGASVAVGVNFLQLSAASEDWSDAVLYAPEEEDGNLHTRVISRGAAPLAGMSDLVDRLYGAETYRALNGPLEKARTTLKSRYFEGSRVHYRDALMLQPDNWAIMEEVASALLMVTEDYTAAVALTDRGLSLNPLAPGLWRAKGEALLALGQHSEARAALDHLIALAPTLPAAWRALAELELAESKHFAALDAIANGFKHDRAAEEQEELLSLQGKVLAAMTLQEHQRLTSAANQIRALDRMPD